MKLLKWVKPALIAGVLASATGCIVAPAGGYHDGYYDREHARYWHSGGWHRCEEHGEYCH